MEKSRIVEALGEAGLRLPALLNEALAANDRAKYLFTLLQVAQGHADHPDGAVTELRAEREAAGLALGELDGLPHAAVREGEARYFMPGVDLLCAQIHGEIDAMLAPHRRRRGPRGGASTKSACVVLDASRGATRTTASRPHRFPRSHRAGAKAPTARICS